MDTREPNSKRFWRLNALMGLRAEWPTSPPADPEQQAAHEALRAEYRRLRDHEAAVRARHARMKTSPRP